jgi:acyl carrier protein
MDDITLEAVIEMLEGVRDGVDYEHVTTLVDDRHLDSFDILAIVSAIDEEFDVEVPAKEIIPANFNSAEALTAMIARLADED